MKLYGKKAEIMHMVVIWEFRENHVIRRITKDLARIQPTNEARAKKVARGRYVQKCSSKGESRAKEDSLERKNKSREEFSREGKMERDDQASETAKALARGEEPVSR